MAGAGLVIIGYFALGMPGMDHSGSTDTMAGMDHTAGEPMTLSPEAFARRMTDGTGFLVNVHVPAGEQIPGTEAAIPYDQIVGDDRLPDKLDRPVLLYCETGRMSRTAGRQLLDAGYTDVSHLEDGMRGWSAAGFALEGS